MNLHNMPTTGATKCSVSLESMVWVRREPGESDDEVFKRAVSQFQDLLKNGMWEMLIYDEEDAHEWVTPPGDYD